MPNDKISLSRKLEILEYTQNSGNLQNTTREFKVQSSQIRQCRKNIEETKLQAENSSAKLAINQGLKLENANAEFTELVHRKWIFLRRWN